MQRVAIGVATKGRPDSIRRALKYWEDQTYKCSLYFSITEIQDLPPEVFDKYKDTIIIGTPGLTKQRNRILNQIRKSFDYLVFFDDDFLCESTWVESMVRYFELFPELGSATGQVIDDGIINRNLTWDDAETRMQCLTQYNLLTDPCYKSIDNPYGCNMIFSLKALHNLNWDERIALYGYEDVDIGGQVRNQGYKIGYFNYPRGIHVGEQTSRLSGKKRGYVQIMNCLYLARKGTACPLRMVKDIFRFLAANAIYSILGDPLVDRPGRLYGNILALKRWATHGIDPEYVLKI